MDNLDIGIMREMARGNIRNLMLLRGNDLRSSFRSIGRSLNIDQGTVRNRIKKLKKDGVIKGWHLEVNPRLFGRQLTCLMLDVDANFDKPQVIKEITSLGNVALVCNYLGTSLHVLLSCANVEELAETSQRIAKLSGEGKPIWVHRPTSAIRSFLKGTDWQIIRSLRENPWKSYEQIAKGVHISSKTTRKRIAKLVEDGAIQLSVDVNFAAFRGIIPASIVVFYTTPMVKHQVAQRITDYLKGDLFFAELGDPHLGVFALSVPNASKLEEITNWVRSQPGVKTCRALILLELIPINVMGEEKVAQTMPPIPIPSNEG